MAPSSSSSSSDLPQILSSISTVYHNYIHPLLPSPIQSILDNVTPILTNLITSATTGDLTSLISTLVIVYVSLRVADYLRRSVIAWLMFVVKIVMVLALVNVAFYVNRVGVGKAFEDAEWLFDMVWGFIENQIASAGGNANDSNTAGSQQWNLNNAQRHRIPVEKRAPKRRSGGWS